jgi:hypothetical protein
VVLVGSAIHRPVEASLVRVLGSEDMAYDDILNALRAVESDDADLEALPLKFGEHLDAQLARRTHLR